MTRLSTMAEYLEWKFNDAGLVELRHHDGHRWLTGWFDCPDKLIREVESRSAVGNFYTSLNAPKIRKVDNRMGGNPITDRDVAWITRLPFDFDPKRPTGVCSTDTELKQACEVRDSFVRFTDKLGWPLPLHAKSGNGYHAVFRCRLPANDKTREQLRHIYCGLHKEFNTEHVSFDRTVRNPGRILRLYDTVNRKGPITSARPHRRATVWIPQDWRQVTRKQVEELASYYARLNMPKQPTPRSDITRTDGNGDYSSLDIVTWFQARGHYKRPLEADKHAVICPWLREHSSPDHPMKTDTVIWESDGSWPSFHCSHSHCEGRTIREVLAIWGDADVFCSKEWGGVA